MAVHALLLLLSAPAVMGHAGINMPSVRREKASKQQEHLASVADRPRGACGAEFVAECDASLKDSEWRSHPCFLSEKDGVPLRIKPGGVVCLVADHGGHVNDNQGAGRNNGDSNGIQVMMHGSECPSMAQFGQYIVAQAPYEMATTEPGLPVTIPADLQEGKYTMLWYWAWPLNHHFTSCLDIIVDSAKGATQTCAGTTASTTSLTTRPCPRNSSSTPSSYTCDTVQPETSNCAGGSNGGGDGGGGGGGDGGSGGDDGGDSESPSVAPGIAPPATCGDKFCASRVEGSYCKTTKTPPVCQGDDVPCACNDDGGIEDNPGGIDSPDGDDSSTSAGSMLAPGLEALLFAFAARVWL